MKNQPAKGTIRCPKCGGKEFDFGELKDRTMFDEKYDNYIGQLLYKRKLIAMKLTPNGGFVRYTKKCYDSMVAAGIMIRDKIPKSNSKVYIYQLITVALLNTGALAVEDLESCAFYIYDLIQKDIKKILKDINLEDKK